MADIPYIEGAGAHSYGDPLKIPWQGKVTIGKYCSIAPGVELNMIGDHKIDWITSYPFHNIESWGSDVPLQPLNRPSEIVIGNDVWLGYECRIMHGVTIGDGAAIGAYAVVARDVRPYAVMVGNPAREIRRRFSDEVVDFLLEVRWWDWPEEKVKENLPVLLSGDMEALRRIA
ncbi:MAG: CatB-related O-acetyltransferase [Actinobacteria bacterium]|nr:CatB-related O-acetyltransferase [Actinomycetota bacterium]MBU1943488.1 CatB-related O-acetyltransferase [Actinomycetota bacterium]MBU2686845.1 CatB-related O-acetyltransferase [Actinomycetota bacterium]